MRLTPIFAAAVLTSAAALAGIGCSASPETVERVDQSVLPADIKSALVTDAQITSVYKETYAKGTVMYRVNYTLDGKPTSTRFNTKMESSPTGVFEQPMR